MPALRLIFGIGVIVAAGNAAHVHPEAAARGAAEVVAGTVKHLREAATSDRARVYCGLGAFNGDLTAFAVEQAEWNFEMFVSPRDPLTQRGFRHEVILAPEAPERWASLCAAPRDGPALTSTAGD